MAIASPISMESYKLNFGNLLLLHEHYSLIIGCANDGNGGNSYFMLYVAYRNWH